MNTSLQKKCWVCNHESPILELHHIVSQRHGGTTGPTILLCNNCHTLCHAQARICTSSNPDTRKKNYIPLSIHRKAMVVVNQLVKGELAYNTKKDTMEDLAIQTLMIPVSPRQLQRLHILKKYYGYSNLQDFLLATIEKITNAKSIPKDDG